MKFSRKRRSSKARGKPRPRRLLLRGGNSSENSQLESNKIFGLEDLSFFEKQQKLFCAVHAINNLFQTNLTSKEELLEICYDLQWLERTKGHCTADGMFSVDVLKSFFSKNDIPTITAVSTENVEKLSNYMRQLLWLSRDSADETLIGFVVSNGAHWIAIKIVYGPLNMWAIWIDSVSHYSQPYFFGYNMYLSRDIERLIQHLNGYLGHRPLTGIIAVYGKRGPAYNATLELVHNMFGTEIEFGLFTPV